jgi:hypothetical protein
MNFKKVISILGFVFVVALIVVSVNAESTATVSATPATEAGEVHQETITTAPLRHPTPNVTLKEGLHTTALENRTEIEAKKLQIEAEVKAKREQFQQKLVAFKDTKKKEIVTRINDRIGTVNKNATDEMTKALDRMTEILTKLSTRVATLKSQGKDTTAAETAITDANTAVEKAKSAVTDQAAKQYVITLTTEKSAKTDVGSTTKQFETDLKTVHQLVVDARQAVANAIKETAKLFKTEKPEEPQPTATDSAAHT